MWNWSENQINLVFLRHGATKSNKEHRYLGKTEEPLSAEGISELKKEKAFNNYPAVDYLFSSPMKRCLETARLLYPEQKMTFIPEWEEMNFGTFEGKSYIELQGDKQYQAWIDSNGTLPFPEGESKEAFIRRCEGGFYRMLSQLPELLHENQNHTFTIGLIVHGGTIMALLSSFYGGEYFDYQVSNGKGYLCKLEHNSEKTQLSSIEKI